MVFKRKDFEDYLSMRRGTLLDPGIDDILLNDAVVIRTQDVFAAAGLSAYAHQIRGFMTIISDPAFVDDFHDLPKLEEIANYFESVAQEAEDRLAIGECKLPD